MRLVLFPLLLVASPSLTAQGPRLHPAIPGAQQDVRSFVVSPDGRWVVFGGDLRSYRDEELYLARTDGTGRAVLLGDGFLDAEIRFTADSRRVLVRSPKLTSVSVDGSAASVELESDTLSAGGLFALTPDASTVVFVSAPAPKHLEVAPADGSLVPTALDILLQPLLVRASATHAVYVEGFGPDQLDSVALDGSGFPATLFSAPSDFHSIQEVWISPDGARVVFALAFGSGSARLWSVPIDGSTAAVEISGPFVAGSVSHLGNVAISPDSSRVVFRADPDVAGRHELFSVPIDGGERIRLHPVPANSTDVDGGSHPSFHVAADGLVLFRANHTISTRFDLYSVPFDGSAPPTRLTGSVPFTGNVREAPFAFQADGDDVVFLFHAFPEVQLWAVSRTGGTARRLSPDLAQDISVTSFAFLPGTDELVYTAYQAQPTPERFFRVPLSGARPARAIGVAHTGAVDVPEFRIASGQVVYLADRALDGLYELWHFPLERTAPNDVPPVVR